MNGSFCPCVCLYVCHTFFTMFPSSYHHEIFRSYYHWQKEGPYKRSRSEVKGQSHRGHNPTWRFPDYNSSLNPPMIMKWCTKLEGVQERCPIVLQDVPSNFMVTSWDKNSLILTQIGRFRTVTPVRIHLWLWNVAQSSIGEMPYCFSRQGSHRSLFPGKVFCKTTVTPSGFDFLFRTRPRALWQQTPPEPVLIPYVKREIFLNTNICLPK